MSPKTKSSSVSMNHSQRRRQHQKSNNNNDDDNSHSSNGSATTNSFPSCVIPLSPLVQEARNLYEIYGEAKSSLEAYKVVWKLMDETKKQKEEEEEEEGEAGGVGADEREGISREHNDNVLSFLVSESDQSGDGDNDAQGAYSKGKGRFKKLSSCNKQIDLIRQLNSLKDRIVAEKLNKKRLKEKKEEGGDEEDEEEEEEEEEEECLDLILALISYNLALCLLTAGKPAEAVSILFPVFHCLLTNATSDDEDDEMIDDERYEGDLSVRIAFLLLDCMLSMAQGDKMGLRPLILGNRQDDEDGTTASVSADKILSFIESYIDRRQQERDEGEEEDEDDDNSDLHGGGGDSGGVGGGGGDVDALSLSPEELKFRLHLYKSRVFFFRNSRDMKVNAKLRAAKKELKSAFELYNHKLVASRGGGAGHGDGNDEEQRGGGESTAGDLSVGSASDIVGKNETHVTQSMGTDGYHSIQGHQQQQHHKQQQHRSGDAALSSLHRNPQLRKSLHTQNQCALYLKANLEHLKANTKKSLKLCAEARHAGERRRHEMSEGRSEEGDEVGKMSTPAGEEIERALELDEALHFNNLAILHQTSGKCYIAMHYYARALSFLERFEQRSSTKNGGTSLNQPFFASDGTATPPLTCEVLYNASICAQQCRNFVGAYECMAKCVQNSKALFGKRPRCWLRMAESCIGIHANQRKERIAKNREFVPFAGKGSDTPVGVVMSPSKDGRFGALRTVGTLARVLGSEKDIEQVHLYPLERAVFCLEVALRLCNGGIAWIESPLCSEEEPMFSPKYVDDDCLRATRLALAYVRLELDDPMPGLQMAQLVLNEKENDEQVTKKSASWKPAHGADNVSSQLSHQLRLRQKATARMYASEALCKMGDCKSALKILLQVDELDEVPHEEKNRGSGAVSSSPAASFESLNRLARQLALIPATSAKVSDGADEWRLTAMAQRRLRHALSAVQTSASGASAIGGDIVGAKRLAISAFSEMGQKLSGVASAPTDGLGRASARRALLYCMLREGDSEGALAVLRAAR